MATPFDFTPHLAPNLPPAAAKWSGFPTYNFVGGHNDATQVPVAALIAATTTVLQREGMTLATYGLESGPLGYRPLREFLSGKLRSHAGISCTTDEILLTSGSLQAMDLINSLLLTRGDTVLLEQDNYGGALTRLARLGVKAIGLPLDRDGLRIEALSATLDDLQRRGIKPKYIYTIPTVQNPTGTILPLARRQQLLALSAAHSVPVFEDDCYADLIWDGQRPPALYALAQQAPAPQAHSQQQPGVIYIGSFSKSVAPALRVGYIVAPWTVLSRILALKTDAGSGALEQMVLAEFCTNHFHTHVPKLTQVLRRKLVTMMDALAENFGTSAAFDDPKGGIFLWVTLPAAVDTQKLAQVALAQGVAINPGPEWSTDASHGRRRLRLCFAGATDATIREGIAKLAEICAAEFGIPKRIANVTKA
jgi:2-aminoadipate transaminase